MQPCAVRRRCRDVPRAGPAPTPRPACGNRAPLRPSPGLRITTADGSRNREIEATSRASAARSTWSARPKWWITFAVGTPVSGWRSLRANCRYRTTVPSLFVRFVSRRYTPTPKYASTGHVQRHAHSRVPTRFHGSDTPDNPPTSTNTVDQDRKCLRSSEVRTGDVAVSRLYTWFGWWAGNGARAPDRRYGLAQQAATDARAKRDKASVAPQPSNDPVSRAATG
jgi:hypothetical protein